MIQVIRDGFPTQYLTLENLSQLQTMRDVLDLWIEECSEG